MDESVDRLLVELVVEVKRVEEEVMERSENLIIYMVLKVTNSGKIN
jgi:hypothetical protein